MNESNNKTEQSKKPVMKSGRAFWGVFFLAIGLLFLIHRIFEPDISVGWVLTLWPILIILIGIAIILKNHYTKFILSGLSALVLALFLYAAASTVEEGCSSIKVYHRDHLSGTIVNNYSLDYDSTVSKVNLEYEFGGGSLMVYPDTANLISVKSNYQNFDFSVDEKRINSLQKVRFWMQDGKIDFFDLEDFQVDLALHPGPVYNMEYEMGALSADMNFSDITFEKIDIETGASALKITLGEPLLKKSVLDVEMGAAKIEIIIPKEASVILKTDIALSTQDYVGFVKVDDNRYESENFNPADNQYIIKLHGGVAAFLVTRQ